MKDHRAIQTAFERYQRERTIFVGSVLDLCRHEPNCELLEAGGFPPLLESLLTDPVFGIRRTAALGLGRLATQSQVVANKIVANGAVHSLVRLLETPIPEKRREALEMRRAAAFALRATCKHAKSLCSAVTAAGALEACRNCLTVSDAETREGAAWLVDTIAGLGEELTQDIIDAEILEPLVSCFEYSEITLKRAVAGALGSIAQHGPAFAQAVAAAGAIEPMAAVIVCVDNTDVRLARQALCALSQIVQGGEDLAAVFVATGSLSAVVRHLGSSDELAQRFAASTLRDVACHGENLAQAVVDTPQALQLLVQSTGQGRGLNTLPGTMALGHLCAASTSLATAIISAGGLIALTVVLAHNPEEPAKCAAAWSLGQAGQHGALHAKAVAESGALLAMTGLEVAPTSSHDLMAKCGKAAASIIAELSSLPSLDALLRIPVSAAVKLAVLHRLATVLSSDNGVLKATFVQTGGLQLALELGEQPNSPFLEAVSEIMAVFPQELVNRFSPAWNRRLLERLAAGGGGAQPQASSAASVREETAVSGPQSARIPQPQAAAPNRPTETAARVSFVEAPPAEDFDVVSAHVSFAELEAADVVQQPAFEATAAAAEPEVEAVAAEEEEERVEEDQAAKEVLFAPIQTNIFAPASLSFAELRAPSITQSEMEAMESIAVSPSVFPEQEAPPALSPHDAVGAALPTVVELEEERAPAEEESAAAVAAAAEPWLMVVPQAAPQPPIPFYLAPPATARPLNAVLPPTPATSQHFPHFFPLARPQNFSD